MKYINKAIKYNFFKKTKILNIIIFTLMTSAFFVLNAYNQGFNKYINKDILSNKSFKSLLITHSNKSSEEIIKEISYFDHIISITPSYSYQLAFESDYFKTNKLSGFFWVYSANNNVLPEINNGTKFPDNNNYYMICPQNFLATLDYNNIKKYSKNNYIDIKNLLNKKIPLKYYGNLNEENQEHLFNIDVKLVGLYQNNESQIDEYICYVNQKVLDDISPNIYNINNENISNNEYIIEIDNYQNIDSIKSKLEEKGYYFHPMMYLDSFYINKISTIFNTINITIIITLTAYIIFLVQKILKKYFFIFKIHALNNKCKSNKQIIKAYTHKIIYEIFIICFITLLLSLLLLFGIKILLTHYPYLIEKIPLIYNYKTIFTYFAYIFLILSFNVYILYKRLIKKNEQL